jgi:uncharacterized protein
VNCPRCEDAKANATFRKCAVTFEQTAYSFRDPFGVEWLDDKADYGEERNILLAMCGAQILSVVYTERKEYIRIISARRATRHEKDIYYRQNAS